MYIKVAAGARFEVAVNRCRLIYNADHLTLTNLSLITLFLNRLLSNYSYLLPSPVRHVVL